VCVNSAVQTAGVVWLDVTAPCSSCRSWAIVDFACHAMWLNHSRCSCRTTRLVWGGVGLLSSCQWISLAQFAADQPGCESHAAPLLV
jgi:hypothetical protein